MPEREKILRIPTERDGVILKTVTALDDEAYLLVSRNFAHYARPSNRNAPDHQTFLNLRKLHKNEDPTKLNMGIWDTKRFNLSVFTGYVELRPESESEKSAILGCTIVDKYQRFGYATTALLAIMQYGRENLDIQTYKAEITQSNYPSQQMVEKLGFEFAGQLYNRLTYVLEQPPETPLQVSEGRA